MKKKEQVKKRRRARKKKGQGAVRKGGVKTGQNPSNWRKEQMEVQQRGPKKHGKVPGVQELQRQKKGLILKTLEISNWGENAKATKPKPPTRG